MRKFILILLACLLFLNITACNQAETDQPSDQPSDSQATESQFNDATADQLNESHPETSANPNIKVETAYGDLYYSPVWKEYIHVEQKQEDQELVAHFRAKMQETDYELFSIILTDSNERGEPVKEFTAADGSVKNVYVEIKELDFAENLTEIDKDNLYAMQEEVNTVLENME